MLEEQVKICEKLGWRIHDCGNGTIELETCTMHDGDYYVVARKEHLVEDIRKHGEEFDLNDYAHMYLEAERNGFSRVPSADGLVEDAEDIKKRLEELIMELTKEEQEWQ